jgi:hypothetical protein
MGGDLYVVYVGKKDEHFMCSAHFVTLRVLKDQKVTDKMQLAAKKEHRQTKRVQGPRIDVHVHVVSLSHS